jgi:uncharacterized protein YyaL (SSP411 family)
MLKGFIDAYKALEDDNYLKSAVKNADFITKNLWTSEGNLFHNYKNGKSSINGYLEDYCFVISAFISLYEVTFDEKWLLSAKQLTDYSLEHFYDEKSGFFSFTSNLDEALIASHFETEDNVIPASNSVMGKNLFLLNIYFENSYYEKVSQRMLQNIIPNLQYPSAYSNWMDLAMHYSEENKELAICGDSALEYSKKINAIYLPNVILAGTVKISNLPFLKDRFDINQTLFYLCQNRTCGTPTDDFEEIITNLN